MNDINENGIESDKKEELKRRRYPGHKEKLHTMNGWRQLERIKL